MENNDKDLVAIFPDKAELVFSDILKNYGLGETDKEFNEYISDDKESREMTIRDAVTVLVQKRAPEEKIVELLQKYIEVPRDIVEKLIIDIKGKLLPLLVIVQEEKLEDPESRQEISKKVFGDEKPRDNKQANELLKKIIEHQNIPVAKEENKPPTPYDRKPHITDVEKNAQKIEQERKPIVSENNTPEKPRPQIESKPDPYKELIE